MEGNDKIYKRMVETNREKNREKELSAITEIRKMVTDDVDVTVASLMKRTGLSRSFFYNNDDVHAELIRAKKMQQGKDFAAPKRAVFDKVLNARIKLLEDELSKRNEECEQLRKENQKLKEIISARNLQAFLNL